MHEPDATLLGAEGPDGAVCPMSDLLSQAKTGKNFNPSTVLSELTRYLWIEGEVLSLRFQYRWRDNDIFSKVDFCLDHPCFAKNFGISKRDFFDYLNPRCESTHGMDGCRGTMTRTQLTAEGLDISTEFRKKFLPSRFQQPWECLLTSTAYGRNYHFLILDRIEQTGNENDHNADADTGVDAPYYQCVGTLRIEDGSLKHEVLEQLMAGVPHSRKKIRLG